MKTKVLFFLSVMMTVVANAQFIKGTVVSASGKTIDEVNVYIDGTVIGTSSSYDGSFQLKLNEYKSGNLIFQKTGFEAFTTKLPDVVGKTIKVVLNPITEIEEIILIPYTDEAYRNNIHYFLNQFIGEHQDDVKIKNQKSLKFSYDRANRILNVKAPETLIIENKRLGYTLQYDLIHFTANHVTNIVSFFGTSFFKEHKVSNKHIVNRANDYSGSINHFLKSVYHDKVKTNGFKVNQIKLVPNPKYPTEQEIANALDYMKEARKSKIVKISDEVQNVLSRKNNEAQNLFMVSKTDIPPSDYFRVDGQSAFLDFKEVLQVNFEKYYFELKKGKIVKSKIPANQSSYLHRVDGPIKISAEGNVENPEELLTQGQFSRNKISSFLPLDYQLPQ